MELHELAMDVVNHGIHDRAARMFDLAFEIEDRIFDLAEALDRLQETLHSLTERCPEGVSERGDDETSEWE